MQPHSVCSVFFCSSGLPLSSTSAVDLPRQHGKFTKKNSGTFVWFKLFKGVTIRRTNVFCSTGLPLTSVVFQRILFLGMLGVKSGVVE